MSDHFGTLCSKLLISMSHKSIRQPSASQIVNRLSVLHKFIRQSQNVGLTLIQILIEVCRRFTMARSSENIQKTPPVEFLRKVVLKICIKFTGEYPCQSAISIKLLCNFFEITLWHGYLYVCCMFSEHLFLRTSLEGSSE